ncbi:MAG TPA: PHB depolymerase family esterase [Verrucomicrobiae bacterium]|nr:PHB depolymerase family esterase [Verrucomicrobiae bacterium]
MHGLASELFLAAGLLCVVAISSRAEPLKPGDHNLTLTTGGRDRTYLLHLPPVYDGKRSLPLVIVLHGGGGNARGAVKMTGFSDKADKEGFVVVYPNGSGRLKTRLLTWNSGNCCGYALDSDVDDVGFIRALIDELVKTRGIDPKRVFVTGMSNGGMMTYRIGCELSDKVAAIAPVAGALDVENCQPANPVPVIIFHGTADEHVLYNGGEPIRKADRHFRVDKSVAYAVSFWVKRDGCAPTPVHSQKGSIATDVYGGGKDGAEVVMYTVNGGGHAWPGGESYLLGAEPTKEISATDLMWDFFVRHPRK